MHVGPVKRLLSTYSSVGGGIERGDSDASGKKAKSVLLSKRRQQQAAARKRASAFTLDYIKLSQMRYDIAEPAEKKLAKHALLEALFETQLWMEPYVQNPYLYITDHEGDFQSPQGERLKEYFKKVFYSQYTKYRKIIQDNTPQEYYLRREEGSQKFRQMSENRAKLNKEDPEQDEVAQTVANTQ